MGMEETAIIVGAGWVCGYGRRRGRGSWLPLWLLWWLADIGPDFLKEAFWAA
jgi:hypothetical protein